jgi:hypothetical protein
MIIPKHIAEELKKYSFIDDVEVKPSKFILKYTVEGQPHNKHVSRRASVEQLVFIVNNIRKQIVKTPFGKGLNSNVVIVGEEDE